MTSDRIRYALAQGLALPEGPLALIGAPGDSPLDVFPDAPDWPEGPEGPDSPEGAEGPGTSPIVVHTFAPEVEAWARRGVTTRPDVPECACAIVTLPRTRDLAEALIARANARASALVVIDGAKTDGIEAIAKALKSRVALAGQVSKAHGKCLWFAPSPALDDWARPEMSRNDAGDWVAPGSFSADGADPASVALAEVLPDTLKGEVADLGAGWGWLSRAVLRLPDIATLHLVEAEATALACARRNVTDPRAAFHWADAITWAPPRPLDAVVMNPPFHVGRKAEPSLGRAFITAAARGLKPQGHLWMVANRHLPYETALADAFQEVTEVGGDARFKLLHAARPARGKRASLRPSKRSQ